MIMLPDKLQRGKSIRVSNDNYAKLAEMGNLTNSFDDIISELLSRAAVAAAPTKRDSEK